MRNVALSVSTLFMALGLAACGGKSPTEEGITTDKGGDRIDATCFDYVGNEVFNAKGLRGSVYDTNGNLTIKVQNKPDIEVRNGGGCIVHEWKIDPTVPANKSALESARQTAPLYVVITNSSDMILLADKFTKVSSETNKADLELQSAGKNDLYKVKVLGGLSLIATPDKSTLSPDLLSAIPAFDKK